MDRHLKEYTDLYEDCAFESVPRDPEYELGVPGWYPEPDGELWRKQVIGYFAVTTAMDAGVGQILDALDKRNLADDTIVWFMTDNGFSTGHHGIWGKGNATFPLNLIDSSFKVSGIVLHSVHISAGVVDDHMVSHYDFSHTLLE